PEAYRRIDALKTPHHPDTQLLRNAIKSGADRKKLWRYCGNIFEEVTELRDVSDIRSTMLKMGAEFACMSGSGSAVFGIFDNLQTAGRCRDILAKRYPFAVCCKTC
ncbi:MAG: 4-(cytidine 5'-diphospho)-2-C-methyl-D-erythritol kinase, partial [Ruminococcus sp.]